MTVVHVRVIGSDGVTERVDFNDRAAGYAVVSLEEPEENVRDLRTSAARVDGSFRVSEASDDGFLQLVVRVSGASWGECVTRWQAARTAYRFESFYYIETEVEGVITRWRTERPDVVPAGPDPATLILKRQTYSVRFRVQPNPSVSIA